MEPVSTRWAEVDEQGRLIIPAELASQFGLQPGARMRLDSENNTFRIHRPTTQLTKVYIEPTTRCNLDCRTCIRNNWDETLGEMTEEIFQKILAGLGSFSTPPGIFFGALGEPLSHPNIVDWVRRAKATGATVELITNGTLLNEARSRNLIEAGLDVIWVSIDGATAESYRDIRLGAELPRVIDNLSALRKMRPGGHHPRPIIGIAFVAMKSNIQDLPAVIALGKRLGAKHFMVSNVLPYTEAMQEEILYSGVLRNITYMPSPWLPLLKFPRMDLNKVTQQAFIDVLNSGCNIELSGYNLGGANDVCSFIESGSIAIGWDGAVSPCPPLLHNHISYLHGSERRSRRHVIGYIQESDLQTMWLDKDYIAYRERVQSFAFAPCTPCGGCELSEANEEDCYGITHPACGGCLWAQGLIQCP